MNTVLGFLTLLVSTNMCLAAVKGGRRIIQDPAGVGGGPHLHLGKGGGGGTLHHSAVVQDPISGRPVVVDQVTNLGGGAGGIKGAGLGAGSAQYALADGPFGQRRVYRVGASQYPYGLLGSDYYSYPQSLLTAPRRVLRRKTLSGNNLSGLSPVGLSSGLRKGGVLVDPTTSQFSIGDSQIKTNVFGARRNLYRTGASTVPYGLMGLDYYSYPRQLLTQRQLGDTFGLRQSPILGGGSLFNAGDSQIRGPIDPTLGQEKVTVVETDPLSGGQRVTTVQRASPFGTNAFGGPSAVIPQQVSILGDGEEFGQRKVTTTTVTQSADPVAAALGQGQVTRTTVTKSAGGLGGGLRGGQIFLSGRPGIGGLRRVKSRVQPVSGALLVDPTSGLGAPIGGFGQRQVAITKSAPVAQAPIFQAQVSPVQILQAPVAAAPIQRRIISSRRPGEVFLSQVARPRVAQRIVSRPFLQQRVASPALGNVQFTLGGNQLIGGPIVAQPSIFSAPRQVLTAPRQVVVAQRPQVISQVKTSPVISNNIFGNRAPQLIYVDGGRRFPGIDIIGGSRIGDPRLGYTQLPISTSRFATLGGLGQVSKIGGPVVSSPLGLSGIGAPTKTVTQEQVIGPAGDPQILTTITKSSPSVGSKIGGLAAGGLAGIGQAPQQVVTQEEVVGPAGDRQIITTVTGNDAGRLAGSKIGGPVVSSPFGLSGIGAPTKTITQEQVVGPAGDPQILTTITKSSPSVGSKIGGLAAGGLAGIGQAPQQVVTQEEVVGPAGDRQIITTVTGNNAGRLAGSKIGGPVVSSPFGLSGIGAPTKTITQEEVIGPAGDSQIVTTVTQSDPTGSSKIGGFASGGPLGLSAVGRGSPATVVQQEEVVNPITGEVSQITTTQELSQDPIEAALSQAALGDSVISSGPLSQSFVDPLGRGQTQVSVDPFSGSGLQQVRETSYSDPATGTVTKVTEVSPAGGLGGGLGSGLGGGSVQQNIADAIVQESISSGLGGGYNLDGYLPRVSFLSQYPYDVPNNQLLRSVVTRPFAQQQQEVEQIYVK